MEGSKSDTVRVLVPRDIGFASGGPVGWPLAVVMALCNTLFILCLPWTWKDRILNSRLLFPILERRRIARGEAPSGHDYAEYPSAMTLDELIKELGYDPQEVRGMGGDLESYQRAYGEMTLKNIRPDIVTRAISLAHVSHW